MILPHEHFEKFLDKEINISKSQISQGSISHNYIRDLLANKNDEDADFPILTDGDFLSGSYARGTKIFPLNDIDVMIVLDGTGLHAMQNGIKLDATVRGGQIYDNPILKHLGTDGLLSSKKVLGLFQKALEKSHPKSTVSKDGQAINVWLDTYGLGIDIVPCFHIIPNNGSQDFYYIPDGSTEGWMTTNPKIDQQISDAFHDLHDKKFKGVVKLIKFWNKERNDDRLQSYHLETVMWHVFAKYPGKISDYGTALKYFFNNAGPIIAALCPDATKLGGHIDTYLSAEDRVQTISNLNLAKNNLNSLFPLPSSNLKLLASPWQKVLGEKFVI